MDSLKRVRDNSDESYKMQLLETDKSKFPMKLSWNNLSYSVTATYSKKERKMKNVTESKYTKTILHNESGFVNSGEALFIMGASGAGKTSMLNAL